MAEELTGEGRKLPETAFSRQMKLLKESPLTPEDRSFLLDLGKDLGYPDLSVQLETLKLFEENLEELIKKSGGGLPGEGEGLPLSRGSRRSFSGGFSDIEEVGP